MVTRVGVDEAKTRLSEYLDRAASRGERTVIERHGKPVGAVVGLDDLRRLEAADAGESAEETEAARRARFYRAMQGQGLIVQRRTGEPVPRSAYRPIEVEGPPLSEQIIAERR